MFCIECNYTYHKRVSLSVKTENNDAGNGLKIKDNFGDITNKVQAIDRTNVVLNNYQSGTATSTNSSSLTGGGNDATSTGEASNNTTRNSTTSDNDTFSSRKRISAGDTVETQNDTNSSHGVKIGNSGEVGGHNNTVAGKTRVPPATNTNQIQKTGAFNTTNGASFNEILDKYGTNKTKNNNESIYRRDRTDVFKTSIYNGNDDTVEGNEYFVSDKAFQNTIQNFTTDMPKNINRTNATAPQTGHTRSSDEHMLSYRNTGVTDSSFNNEYDRSGRTKSHTDKMIIDADELSDNGEGEGTKENYKTDIVTSDGFAYNIRLRTTSSDVSNYSFMYTDVTKINAINEEKGNRGLTENEISTYHSKTSKEMIGFNVADQIYENTTRDPNDVETTDNARSRNTTDTIQSLAEGNEDLRLEITTEHPNQLISKDMFDSSENAVFYADNVNNQSQSPNSIIGMEETTVPEPNARLNEFQKYAEQDNVSINGIDNSATHMFNTPKHFSAITKDDLYPAEFDVSNQPTEKRTHRTLRVYSTENGQEKTDIMTENDITIDPMNIRLSKSIDHTEEPTGESTQVADKYDVDTIRRHDEAGADKLGSDSNTSVMVTKNADVSKTSNIMELFGFRGLANTAETTTVDLQSSINNKGLLGNADSGKSNVNNEITNSNSSTHSSKSSEHVLTDAQIIAHSNKTLDESLDVHKKGGADFVSSTITTHVESVYKSYTADSTILTSTSDVLHEHANETVEEVGDENESDQKTVRTNDTHRDGSSAHLVESSTIHNVTVNVNLQDLLEELNNGISVHKTTDKENEVHVSKKGYPTQPSKLLKILLFVLP